MATNRKDPNIGLQYWLSRDQWIGYVPITRVDRASTGWCDTLDEAIEKYNQLAITLLENPTLVERASNDKQWHYITNK